ncbi:MAG: head-tail connector protein [Clostridia bacterium]
MPDNPTANQVSDLEMLRLFGGYDPDVEDAVLELSLEAARQWLADAGATEPATGNATYKLALYRLATHFYDTRGNTDAVRDAVPPTVFGIMHQVRSTPKQGGSE